MRKIGKRGSHSRRMFLRGAGGFTLALPFLPSLLSSTETRAQVPVQKRFIGIGTGHGGVPAADMFPADGVAEARHELIGEHHAHHGALPYSVDGDTATISPVLSGPSAVLTPELAAKINVVRGLGVTRYMGHHYGGQLGNFAYNGSGAGATIDQTLAWSDSFYPDLAGVVQRSIHVDTDTRLGRGLPWGFADPIARTGDLANIPVERSSIALFDALFGGPEPAEPETPRRPVVDRVLDHYRGMTSGRFADAARMSADDRRRLDEHMNRMFELQRRLETRGSVSCGALERPTGSAGHTRDDLRLRKSPIDEVNNATWYQLFNDVIVAAFMCNASSIATVYARTPFVDGWNGNDWHEQVAHAGDGETLGRHVNAIFRNIFLDLAQKLDVEEADGRTFLDNSLLQMTQEHGFLTHFALEMPLVTAGSAGGHFETGRFVDYRFRESTLLPKRHWSGAKAEFREGLTWNQWFANVAMAMDLRPDEWRHPDNAGYGSLIVGADHAAAFHDGILNAASDPLPLLVRA
ncbi:MAG: DUF1552 domain-containing protein [Myxococcota bacterium]